MNRDVLRPDVAVPAVITAFGIAVLLLVPAQVVAADSDEVGTRFFPYLVATTIALAGLADLSTALWRRHRGTTTVAELTPEPSVGTTSETPTPIDDMASEPMPRVSHWLSYLFIVGGVLVWIYSTAFAGYLIGSLTVITLTALAFGLKEPLKLGVLAVSTIAVTYYVFAELLQVQLHLGGNFPW